MHTFKIYYSVNGSNRRRSKELTLGGYYTLLEAWTVAMDWAIASTEDDEVLDSIRIIKEKRR